MSLRNHYLAAAIIVLICASQAAFAQYESSDKSRLGLGVSLLRPTGSHLRNIAGTWYGPTVDINLLYDSLSRPTATASIGWFGEESNTAKASLVPIKLTYIKRFGEETGSKWYVGGGLDVCFVHYQGLEYDPFIRSTRFVDESGTPIGINLLAGMEFGGAWYTEMRYDAVGKLSLPTGGSVSFDGLSVNIGTRLAF